MRTIATKFSKSDPTSMFSMLTEAERVFQTEVRKFAVNVVKPHVYQMDAAGRLDPELIAQIKAQGFMNS